MSKLEPTRTYSNHTATEKLRRLLDERGVEWWEATPCKTKWNSPIIGGPVAAREWNGEMVLDTGYIAVTPEQAIAATLGATDAKPTQVESSGTCHITDNGPWGYPYVCSACGASFDPDVNGGEFNYCPNCGRRIEQ